MPRWATARYTAAERATIRPALTVTGLSGGSTGAGAKGTIPHRAVARISVRLVPEQEPGEIAGLLRRYVAAKTPSVVRSRLTVRGSARPVLVPRDHPAISAAVRAVTTMWGAPPIVRRSGGSIPAVAALQRRLGATPVLLGFGVPDDHAHGPNERLSLPTFFSGVETVVQFFGEYGRTGLPVPGDHIGVEWGER
jgi:acetylornithine deacetylase/succinyl-diaminopimelate desuccinylase-like protein